jgi:hypothetical protein
MDTANEFAILTLAAAASFASALLLNWVTLTALFHLLSRPARVRSLPTPPGEAHPELRRVVPALPGVLRRAGPEPRPLTSSHLASGSPIR